VIVGEYTLRNYLERYYGASEDAMDDLLGGFLEEDLEFVEEEDDDSVAVLAAEVDEAPVVRFINGLLTDAVRKGVSDIHIEPYEKEVRVRYRLDVTLYEVMKPAMKMKAALTSRIKILSDLNIAERRVRASISGGETIAGPLKESGVFPPMVVQMINMGEQTGGLDTMLTKITDFYDDEVDAAVEALLAAMEPIMIVVLGVVVGGMIVAMYLPIFDMIKAVG
jgi:hypothetical protein